MKPIFYWPRRYRWKLGPLVTVRTFDPPHTKDIEFCENRGCAFNANTGKCSSTFGQCFGYFPPNGRDEQRAAERADDHLKTMTLQSVDKTPEQLPMRGVGSSDSSAWVRCEDRHPALGEIVWLWEEGRGPWIGSRDNPDNEGWLWGNAYGTMWHNGVKWDADVEHDDEYKPTHWQPLPLLPNGGDEPRAGSAASPKEKNTL